MGGNLWKLGTPVGGDAPAGFRAGLRAFVDRDVPVVAEVVGPWSNYGKAKPPIVLSTVFLGVVVLTGFGLYATLVTLPRGTVVGPLFLFARFATTAFFCFFPLRRIWRAALRARVAAER